LNIGNKPKKHLKKEWILGTAAGVITAAAVVLSAVACLSVKGMHTKLEEVGNQLSYLQDNTDIIMTDLHNMETNIETALEESASLIEEYSIIVTDCDFSAGTYDVAISVIPKEYTETTETSIYFGTQEYPLTLQGFTFYGTATLPMDQSYDENVTVLFTDGGRRSTEVLQSYTGFQTSLENVLYGSIANMPTYQDGTLTVRDNAVVFLEGNGSYEFAKLELIATADSEEIYHYDLLGNTGGVIAAEEPESEEEVSDSTTDDGEPRANTDRLDQTADDAGNEDAESRTSDAETASDQETQTVNPESTEAADEATTNNDTTNGNTSGQEPVSGFSTERELNLTYALPAGTAVRIYLTATTEDGYQFTYDLFNGVTSEDEEDEFGFETSEDYFADNYAVYDKKQNVYFIQ
jgi:hypothetical protein